MKLPVALPKLPISHMLQEFFRYIFAVIVALALLVCAGLVMGFPGVVGVTILLIAVLAFWPIEE